MSHDADEVEPFAWYGEDDRRDPGCDRPKPCAECGHCRRCGGMDCCGGGMCECCDFCDAAKGACNCDEVMAEYDRAREREFRAAVAP